MKDKIVIGVVSFIGVVSVGLIVLLIGVSPIQLKRSSFSSQLNEQLITAPEHYINASEKVLAECKVVLDEVDPKIMAVYPAHILYQGKKYEFQIVIEDKKIPTVTLKDNKAVYECYIGNEFIAADLVNVQDDSDTTVFFIDNQGNEMSKITLEKNGNFDYFIVAKDSSDNRSSKIRVRFEVGQDKTPPTFFGVDAKTLKVGDNFDVMEGVSAVDNADGDLTYKIKVEGRVDTSKVGQTTLTYSVVDSNNNEAVATRLVTVTESGSSGQPDVGNGPFLTSDQITERDEKIAHLLENELNYFNDDTFIEQLNRYLIYHFNPSSSVNDKTSYSVIVKERGDRAAMARAVKVFLDKRGIENVIVIGDYEGMVWNIVKVNDTYRHLDVYANAIGTKEDMMLLKKTNELDGAYSYAQNDYPKCN